MQTGLKLIFVLNTSLRVCKRVCFLPLFVRTSANCTHLFTKLKTLNLIQISISQFGKRNKFVYVSSQYIWRFFLNINIGLKYHSSALLYFQPQLNQSKRIERIEYVCIHPTSTNVHCRNSIPAYLSDPSLFYIRSRKNKLKT